MGLQAVALLLSSPKKNTNTLTNTAAATMYNPQNAAACSRAAAARSHPNRVAARTGAGGVAGGAAVPVFSVAQSATTMTLALVRGLAKVEAGWWGGG